MNVLKTLSIAACGVLLAVPGTAYSAEKNAAGYLSYASHDEIVKAARAESGKFMATFAFDQKTIDKVMKLFKAKYSFVDPVGQEVGDADARVLLEISAGTNPNDVIHMEEELGLDSYYPHTYKMDFLGMAGKGVVDIPVKMINPKQPMVVSVGSALAGISYNSKVLPADLVPKSYEDLLNPKLKNSGLLWADVSQASGIAALAVVWGENKVLDYARKLGAQRPVWTKGATRSITAMAAGEYAIGSINHYHSAYRIQQRNAPHLRVVLLEPVPVRLNNILGINKTSPRPATATLFIEFLTTIEVQDLFNKEGPIKGSVFREGSLTNTLVKGKKIAFVGWEDVNMIEPLQKRIFEAWGFPVAKSR
jgi:ABC-type Fe3+ transport system substrate-binding protein